MLKFIKNLIKKFKQKRKFKKSLKLLNKGYYSQAEEKFSDLTESNVLDLKMVYFNYASALLGNEKFEKAEHYLKKAIEEKEDIDFFWGTLGEVYLLQKKWKKAEKSLKKAVKLKPDKKIYKNKLDIVKGDEEDRNNYLKYYSLIKKALKVQKNEEWEKSINIFKKALNFNDEMGYAYNQIGAIYNNELDDNEKAIKYFKLALEKEPENKMFKMNLKRAR